MRQLIFKYLPIHKNSLKNAPTSQCPEILTHFSIYSDNTKTISFDVMQPNVCNKKKVETLRHQWSLLAENGCIANQAYMK